MANRNKQYVLTGAPDIKSTGGFTIFPPQNSADKYPKDAKTPLTLAGLAKGGYVSEDGLTKTVDRSTEKIKDWNGDVILIVQTDHSVILKLVCMESANAAVLKMIYGDDNVIVSEDGKSITTIDTSDDLPHQGLDFNILGGRGSKIRVFAPDTQVTSVGDVKFVKNDVIRYELELECFDPAGDGRKIWQFIDLADLPPVDDTPPSEDGALVVDEDTIP